LRSAELRPTLDDITGTAVLEFGSAETLPPGGAISPAYSVSANRAPPIARTPARKAGFSTAARYFR